MTVRRVAGRRCRWIVRHLAVCPQPCQLVVDGLVRGDIRAADAGVESVEIPVEQADVELELQVAQARIEP